MKDAPACLLEEVLLEAIIQDHDIQSRCEISWPTVDDYAELIKDGCELPPPVLYAGETPEGLRFWIGDGWHRVLAHVALKATVIAADVRDGGREAALRHALGANADHGLRRSNADKRRAVEMALKHFPTLSNRQIAELCQVTHTSVNRIKKEAEVEQSSTPPPSAPPEQRDFFEQLNEDFSPAYKTFEDLLQAPCWVDPEIPSADKVKAMEQLRTRLRTLDQKLGDSLDALKKGGE